MRSLVFCFVFIGIVALVRGTRDSEILLEVEPIFKLSTDLAPDIKTTKASEFAEVGREGSIQKADDLSYTDNTAVTDTLAWFSQYSLSFDDDPDGYLDRKSFSLRGEDLTNEGLIKHVGFLSDAHNLEWLFVNSPLVTDEGVLALKGLGNVEWLRLAVGQLSQETLSSLSEMENLDSLTLRGGEKVDLSFLRDLPALVYFSTSADQLTEENIESIVTIEGLRELSVSSRLPMKDSDFKAITRLTSLETLDLRGLTGLTEPFVDALVVAMPNTEIMLPEVIQFRRANPIPKRGEEK